MWMLDGFDCLLLRGVIFLEFESALFSEEKDEEPNTEVHLFV